MVTKSSLEVCVQRSFAALTTPSRRGYCFLAGAFTPLNSSDSNASRRSLPFNPHRTDLLNRHLGRRPSIITSDLMLLVLDGGRSMGYLSRIRGRVKWLPRSSGKLSSEYCLHSFLRTAVHWWSYPCRHAIIAFQSARGVSNLLLHAVARRFGTPQNTGSFALAIDSLQKLCILIAPMSLNTRFSGVGS